MWTRLPARFPEAGDGPLPGGQAGHPAAMARADHPLPGPRRRRERCVACYLCAVACPVDCIALQAAEDEQGRRYPAFFRINFSRCIFCGFCEEACPTCAIQLTPDFEMGEYTGRTSSTRRKTCSSAGPGNTPATISTGSPALPLRQGKGEAKGTGRRTEALPSGGCKKSLARESSTRERSGVFQQPVDHHDLCLLHCLHRRPAGNAQGDHGKPCRPRPALSSSSRCLPWR